MRVRLTPEAHVELREVTEWYAERSPNASAGFVIAYKRARAQNRRWLSRWHLRNQPPSSRRLLDADGTVSA